jgi:predicted transcriptional regulator
LVQSVLKPRLAWAIAVPNSRIYKATLDCPALVVIRAMHAKVYTHVPVMQDKRLVGVFSENTVLSYLADKEEVVVDLGNATLREFEAFIPLKAHNSEVFRFVSRNTLLADIAARFREDLKENQRLGAVFMTENGRETEEILGLITAWDVAGAESRGS